MMASKNNNIRREGADAYPDPDCRYNDGYKYRLWLEGWNTERMISKLKEELYD